MTRDVATLEAWVLALEVEAHIIQEAVVEVHITQEVQVAVRVVQGAEALFIVAVTVARKGGIVL